MMLGVKEVAAGAGAGGGGGGGSGAFGGGGAVDSANSTGGAVVPARTGTSFSSVMNPSPLARMRYVPGVTVCSVAIPRASVSPLRLDGPSALTCAPAAGFPERSVTRTWMVAVDAGATVRRGPGGVAGAAPAAATGACCIDAISTNSNADMNPPPRK
jgi:hypothetical protein